MPAHARTLLFWLAAALLLAATPTVLLLWPVRSRTGPARALTTGAHRTSAAGRALGGSGRASRARAGGARSRKRQPRRPPTTSFTVTGRLGPSAVAIRRGSADGPIVYAGTVGEGVTLRFRGARLFVQAASAGNLEVRVGEVAINTACLEHGGDLLSRAGDTPADPRACLQYLGS